MTGNNSRYSIAKFDDEELIVKRVQIDKHIFKNEVVMDKEAFMLAYNRWVKGNDTERIPDEPTGFKKEPPTEWIGTMNGVICGRCGNDSPYRFKYCPHCGSVMNMGDDTE